MGCGSSQQAPAMAAPDSSSSEELKEIRSGPMVELPDIVDVIKSTTLGQHLLTDESFEGLFQHDKKGANGVNLKFYLDCEINDDIVDKIMTKMDGRIKLQNFSRRGFGAMKGNLQTDDDAISNAVKLQKFEWSNDKYLSKVCGTSSINWNNEAPYDSFTELHTKFILKKNGYNNRLVEYDYKIYQCDEGTDVIRCIEIRRYDDISGGRPITASSNNEEIPTAVRSYRAVILAPNQEIPTELSKEAFSEEKDKVRIACYASDDTCDVKLWARSHVMNVKGEKVM